MSTERVAKLLSDATGACPCDTSRTDCEDIDGWQPKQGCVDVCGMAALTCVEWVAVGTVKAPLSVGKSG
jgi:hypothetical protein